MTDVKYAKARLRREATALRDRLSDRTARSAAIHSLVMALPSYQAAAAIHCYLAIRSEVETRPLIALALAAGKAVAVPVVDTHGRLTHSWIDTLDADAFVAGALGTPRPRVLREAYPGAWALTIVPLLAFDPACFRLGYGKGYYDHLLGVAGGIAVGVAFAAQAVPSLPREPHDHPLDLIVTEEGVVVPA